MILKELDPFHGSQSDLAARIAADRMAYYLRRFYRRSNEVDVLNGLRVRSGKSIVSVDHLLLHSRGLIVMQREQVAGKVQIDDDGQWRMQNGGAQVVVGSPITRAYVQALLLKAFLDRRASRKRFFDRLDLDVLVVVSDTCELEWPATGRLPEVCFREDVFERISARLQEYGGGSEAGFLSALERRTLGEFLCHSHLPVPGDVST